MKPLIKLPRKWMERSLAFGEQSVDGYDKREKEASRIYARPGIDKSVPHQFFGKGGECAYCLHFGLDPERKLDWSKRLDPGWDVEQLGVLVDVKSTRTQFLMWPITKNEWLHQCRADVFVMVRYLGGDLFEIGGWITKPDFIRRHHVATADDGKRLDPGTKHLHVSELSKIDSLSRWIVSSWGRASERQRHAFLIEIGAITPHAGVEHHV
jgi:hypothetical protein